MATVVNNPPPEKESSGMGFLLGVIVLILFVFVLIYWGLPAIRQTAPAAPQGGSSESQINVDVPEQVDVNVNQGEGE